MTLPHCCFASVLGTLLLASLGFSQDATKEVPVPFTLHSGHFESNQSGLKGDSSFLVLKDRASFDKIFGVAFTMGRRPNIVPNDAFEKKQVLAVVQRGDAVVNYSKIKVVANDRTLTLSYTATRQDSGGTARFASPLIVSLEKSTAKEVVFVENGKTVKSLSLDK